RFTDACFDESEDDMIRGLLNSGHPFLKGITFEQLEREHSVRLNVSEPGTPYLPFADGAFGTPSGKCELGAKHLGYVPPRESRKGNAALTSKFPLEMISSKFDDNMNSTFGYRGAVDSACSTLHLHPVDAAARKIQNGDRVRAFNDRGSLLLKAHVEDGM